MKLNLTISLTEVNFREDLCAMELCKNIINFWYDVAFSDDGLISLSHVKTQSGFAI